MTYHDDSFPMFFEVFEVFVLQIVLSSLKSRQSSKAMESLVIV